MKFNYLAGRAVMPILLSFGLFQLVAATVSLLFWVLIENWRPYAVFIGVAGSLTSIITYMILNHNR